MRELRIGMPATGLLLALAMVPACHDEGSIEDDDTGTDTDSDTDADSDGDTDADGGWCGDGLNGDCPEDWGELMPIFEATALDGEVRFAALSGDGRAILAERTTGDTTTPLAIVGDALFMEIGLAEPEPPPSDPLTPVAISWHTALLCSATTCALWSTEVEAGETGQLEPVSGGEVPSAMTAARGLTRISGNPESLCVYGDGIACFDGETWTTEVEPGSGPPFNDVELVGYDGPPFAVGDEGRILRQTETGWVAEESGTEEALVGVASGWGDVLAIVGAEGTLIVGASDPSSWQTCLAEDASMLGLNWTVTDSPITNWLELLTAAGTVLRIDEAGDTCAVAGDLAGNPVAINDGMFGTCFDTRVLTEQALYHKIVDCTD